MYSKIAAKKLKYYKNLDGIRAIAVLMVMVFHFFQDLVPHSKIVSVLSTASLFGRTGVTLFFVLSGFLISRILLNTKKEVGFFTNFYLRRILRIFPLYYLGLTLYYYLIPSILHTGIPSVHQQFFYFIYLQGFADAFGWNAVGPIHFWSLAVEEHFYLFWPFVIYSFSNKNLTKFIIGILIASLLIRVFMLNNGYPVVYFTFARFDSLAAGALLAILEQKNAFRTSNTIKYIILLGITFIPTILMLAYFKGESNKFVEMIKYSFLSFFYFSVIGIVLSVKKDHLINKILKTKLLSYTGKISYGLYVYHPLIFSIFNRTRITSNLVLDFIAKFTLAFLVSAISYSLFESPFLRLKKHFKYNRKLQPASPLL